MRVARFIGKCSDNGSYTGALSDGTALIDCVTPRPNVALGFKVNEKAVHVPFPRESARDLLDLGVTVYIADELKEREESADGWNRDFDCVFPVQLPDAWKPSQANLQELLRQLSGDNWVFEFVQRKCLPRRVTHRRRIAGHWDFVCLFSGGLDSLSGAAHLLGSGKRVLLVGHQAEGVTASAQKRLAKVLKIQFPGQVELVQIRVARTLSTSPTHRLPKKCENSHRPRSFLFLSIACALADALNVPEVIIPENGLIGLNIPLQPSRIGTLSTRTAHPLFIHEFNRVVNDVQAYGGRISNPFMYMSKTDVATGAPQWLTPHLRSSISCAHAGDVRWAGKPGVPHCGYCIPCVYRRLSLHALGLDMAKDYVFDVFTDLGSLQPTKRLDLRAVAGFATRLSKSSDFAIETMVCSNGAFDPKEISKHGPSESATFEPWRRMLQKWAGETLSSLSQLCDTDTKGVLSL
jgi:7-cyano-7-deazaguanine synthase in queuosine biosynthesis